ncbi:probable carbohydrate esterase At4g34215 isoform X2 [Rutidosis leptorrhynchoides]|uniref:probable carbohydrate esterase At4g34215 isoform X2 n=1 Tax=Rutidosis leptorrhynchoides TaxID=125765 RepID=UPI003A99BA27
MASYGLKLTLFLLFIIIYEYWSSHVNFIDLVNSGSSHLVKDVFILAGQSNMAGRGGVIDGNWDGIIPTEMKSRPGQILRLSGDLKWKVAKEPLHVDIDVNKTCGIGPGMAFANAVVNGGSGRFGVVGLVPCAIGGSGIDEWARGGRLYQRLVRRAFVSTKGGGEVKGVLWFQGERDTVNISDAESYKGKLSQLFLDLRMDLKSPLLPVIQISTANTFPTTNPILTIQVIGVI